MEVVPALGYEFAGAFRPFPSLYALIISILIPKTLGYQTSGSGETYKSMVA